MFQRKDNDEEKGDGVDTMVFDGDIQTFPDIRIIYPSNKILRESFTILVRFYTFELVSNVNNANYTGKWPSWEIQNMAQPYKYYSYHEKN